MYKRIFNDRYVKIGKTNYSKKIKIWFYYKVMFPKDADGIANSADPGQTTQEQSDLHLHYELQTVQTLIRLFHVIQMHVPGGHWSGKSQGNLIFLQGQGKVREF